nr:fluoride efflux transporter CrcB [Sediminibacillus massiliensis]
MVYILVGVAGSLGAILRYLVGVLMAGQDTVFPFSTLTVNLLGSFVLAWLTVGLFKKITRLSAQIKTAIGTGFVGSFTTFSTLSVETVMLWQQERMALAVLYILASLLGGLVLSKAGFLVGERMNAR